jgi:hypothetical protein
MSLMLLVAALQLSQVEPLRAPPIDQCGDDPAFVEYREKLTGAIALKDADALRPLVDLKIKYSFGPDGDDGWSGFVRIWNLDRPADSELWLELSQVLNLGCEWDDGQPTAPGNFSRLSEFDHPLPVYFAVQKRAALRTRPDDSAPLVMELEDHVLLENFDVAPEGWLNAQLTDGRTGFVRMSAVRSAIDYRAGFEKRDGKWVMTIFIAGD